MEAERNASITFGSVPENVQTVFNYQLHRLGSVYQTGCWRSVLCHLRLIFFETIIF